MTCPYVAKYAYTATGPVKRTGNFWREQSGAEVDTVCVAELHLGVS